MASLGGLDVFGLSVKIRARPAAVGAADLQLLRDQRIQVVWGGTRGRGFFVSGVLVGEDISVLTAAEAVLLSYDDGIGRVLVDTLGRVWPAVVFSGQYQPDPMGPRPLAGDVGWGLPYKATFFSLL